MAKQPKKVKRLRYTNSKGEYFTSDWPTDHYGQPSPETLAMWVENVTIIYPKADIVSAFVFNKGEPNIPLIEWTENHGAKKVA